MFKMINISFVIRLGILLLFLYPTQKMFSQQPDLLPVVREVITTYFPNYQDIEIVIRPDAASLLDGTQQIGVYIPADKSSTGNPQIELAGKAFIANGKIMLSRLYNIVYHEMLHHQIHEQGEPESLAKKLEKIKSWLKEVSDIGLMEGLTDEVIDKAIDKLMGTLGGIIEHAEIAEMLLKASEGFPDSDLAKRLSEIAKNNYDKEYKDWMAENHSAIINHNGEIYVFQLDPQKSYPSLEELGKDIDKMQKDEPAFFSIAGDYECIGNLPCRPIGIENQEGGGTIETSPMTISQSGDRITIRSMVRTFGPAKQYTFPGSKTSYSEIRSSSKGDCTGKLVEDRIIYNCTTITTTTEMVVTTEIITGDGSQTNTTRIPAKTIKNTNEGVALILPDGRLKFKGPNGEEVFYRKVQ